MQVQVNGKPHTLDARKTITELLTELQVSREQGIAIAINEQVVSRREFDETYVEDGDEVEIIQATSGG